MPLKTHVDEEPQMNLVSMIDVILVLIIFFMVATKFREEDRRIDLKVPAISQRGALTAAPDPKIVNVYSDGQISYAGKTVDLPNLTKQLAAARVNYQGLQVFIRGDRATPHGRMTEVYDACKQAGVQELAIAVKLETKQK